MRKPQLLAPALLLVLLLVACAPAPAPPVLAPQATSPSQPAVPALTTSAPAPAAPTAPIKAAWEVEWERTLEAAKKEGTIVLYFGPSREASVAISNDLGKKFGIKVEVVAGYVTQLGPKLLAERRAQLYLVDLFLGGVDSLMNVLKPAGALDLIEPALILPEVKNPNMWDQGKLPFTEKDGFVLGSFASPQATIVINTDLVKPEEMTSYRDLLNPKWTGKIVLADPQMAGAGANTAAFMLYNLGEDYVRQLANQEPLIIRDHNIQIDWVARGKYPIALSVSPATYVKFKNVGAPLKQIQPKEGTFLSSAAFGVTLVNKAAHPNAAKLFVNWVHTKETQTILSKILEAQSNRLDVPTDFLPSERVRQPGVNYWRKDTEEGLQKVLDARAITKPIFAHLEK